MAKCFVIQPFDNGGPYDKRYHDVMAPAIRDAGFDPYRVDEDPSTTILIEDIEKGIREAEICLADITTNNPNIWYEVGFALANGKPIVLICVDPRPEPFPFDVRHRPIINYKLHSSSDFEKLRSEITARLQAQAKKAETLQTVAAMSEIQTTRGLSSHEIAVLVTIVSERDGPVDAVSAYIIKNRMSRSGYTPVASGLALESLLRKQMIEFSEERDQDGDKFLTYQLTVNGIEWLLANEDRLSMRKKREGEGLATSSPISDEDIPF